MNGILISKQAHRNLAREAVRKSLVLLKNGKTAEDRLLPLPKKVPKILVAGSHADNLGFQCGGWTINWQGFNGNNATSGRQYFDSFCSQESCNSYSFEKCMITLVTILGLKVNLLT